MSAATRPTATAGGATAAPDDRPFRVAVIGAGVVGGATAKTILADAALPANDRRLAPHGGRPLALAGIAGRTPASIVAKGFPPKLAVADPAALAADPTIDAIVETVGGDEPARTLIATALARGAGVVTANKHVIAHHGPALEALARKHHAPLRFEAAVGGGIPVLGPLASDLAANTIRGVRGIVNGTTNYILTAMARDGAGYAETLTDAQKLGYAEADPTGDVEGADAVNKLVILVRLAFGRWLDPASIPAAPPTLDPNAPARRGITGLTGETIAGAAALGLAIKLVAGARRLDDGTIEAAVLPTALPRDLPLARTDGVLNRIEITGDPIGTVGLAGPGAGGGATSSAVLGDLLALARGGGSTWAGLPPAVDATAAAPANTLRSPLLDSSVREWFVVAPVDPASLAHDTGVRAVESHGGLALHFSARSLAAVRAHLAQEDAPAGTLILPVEPE